MSRKFVRFVAALAIMVSIIGNSGVALADHGATPSVDAPQPLPLDLPSLIIAPATSLGVQFVHVATAANIFGIDTTIIDHPLTNGNASAKILVTPNSNPGGVGGTYNDHNIGVYYTGGKWRIFNQDAQVMPLGAAFNVIIPTAGAGVFVHTATVGNTTSNDTFIDNVLANGNPDAMVFVTLNSGGVGGMLDDHPIGVYYSGGYWRIFNQDLAAMPLGAAFNVFVLPAGTGVFVHTATVGNIIFSSITVIDNALTNGNPNAIVFVTPNSSPGGGAGTSDSHPIGAHYSVGDGKWAILNQDTAAMPAGATFNVLVLAPVSDKFVHTATAANIVAGRTTIDNALTNEHPNAMIFATQNYNPGGIGGMFNDHNIGVFYNTGANNQWTVFNQDNVAVPSNAAFNVLIPNPDTSVFVHKATAANISANMTTIDYPLTNGNPNAIVLVTPNYNPGGVGGAVDDDHPIGVYYNGSKWAVFNEDGMQMPINATFNVFVPAAGAALVDVFVHEATAANIVANTTVLDSPMANGDPQAIILVTPNLDPGGVCPCVYNNHPIGVYYSAGRWRIFNQDNTALPANAAMPENASFNVYVVGSYKNYLPLILR